MLERMPYHRWYYDAVPFLVVVNRCYETGCEVVDVRTSSVRVAAAVVAAA